MSYLDHHQKQRQFNNFENSKLQCLGKRDKSSAGRIDPKAVEICALINDRDEFYTTSSCAGRCFLYRGQGVKATDTFARFRVSHDLIHEPGRYFNLNTLESDRTGGGDPISTVGQYEHAIDIELSQPSVDIKDDLAKDLRISRHTSTNCALWLRYEPFILHVACRCLSAASELMTAARPSFKNVGLTTWKKENGSNNFSKYLVAIWGDEGLDMPLTTSSGEDLTCKFGADWLAALINERHERNWSKIERFVQAVRDMPASAENDDDETSMHVDDTTMMLKKDSEQNNSSVKVPSSFDILGDVALLHSISTTDPQQRREIGEAILKKNKAIKVVALRENNLEGYERSIGNLTILAGAQRSPMVTTHCEYGIKCVVDLSQTFFSPRMGKERLRICQQVARGERVLVVFAGVAMDALQIAGRTEASSVTAMDMNPIAVQCAERGRRMLERNKSVKCPGAAERISIFEGDVVEKVPLLFEKEYFDRILAPRPKDGGSLDGDLGTGDHGMAFLDVLLPVLKHNGGECHWYDFVADWELPRCDRTRSFLEGACRKHGLAMQVLHVANAGSVAMRQYRVCVDIRVSPILAT